MSENGISLADGRFINFRECAYRYYKKTAAAGNVSANGMLRNFLLSFIPHRCPRRFSFRPSIQNGAFFVFHPHTNVFISCKMRSAHMAIRPLTGAGVRTPRRSFPMNGNGRRLFGKQVRAGLCGRARAYFDESLCRLLLRQNIYFKKYIQKSGSML